MAATMALPPAGPDVEVDSERLGAVMKALANPVRLDLLKALQAPKTLGEIRLRARRADRVHRPDRWMSRVTVREHLEHLLSLSFVTHRRTTRDGRSADEYVVNQRQLFAVTEELRQVARLRPEGLSVAEATRTGAPAAEETPGGPVLVLVNGVAEGRAFPLGPARAGEARRWLIGRRRGLAVCLDYDPFLSTENSEVSWRDGEYWIEDRPGSRNGTQVNWRRLAKGERRPLAHGDVVGVGRSLLLFRTS